MAPSEPYLSPPAYWHRRNPLAIRQLTYNCQAGCTSFTANKFCFFIAAKKKSAASQAAQTPARAPSDVNTA